MAPFQGMNNAKIKGMPPFYRGKPIYDSYKTLSEIAKGGAKPLPKGILQPVVNASRLGPVITAGVLAGVGINAYGKKVVKDIDAMSKKTSEAQAASTKKLREELLKRKKATGMSLRQRQQAKRDKENKTTVTGDPKNVGVGWEG